MKSRHTVNIDTYERVKRYFSENPSMKLNMVSLSVGLNVNYDSMKIIIQKLLDEKYIHKSRQLYSLEVVEK